MSEGRRRDWREICQEVVTETRPERMNALLEELLHVLEELPHGESSFGARDNKEPLRNSAQSHGMTSHNTSSRQDRP